MNRFFEVLIDTASMLLLIVVGVAIVTFGIVFNGFTLSTLWNWFLVPPFKLPELPLVPAIGIYLILRFFTHVYPLIYNNEYETKNEKILRLVVEAVVNPGALLILGFIANQFM